MNGIPSFAWLSSSQSVGTEFPAIAQQRNLCIGEQFDFANQTIAAAKFPGTSRFWAISISPHAKGIRIFQRFNRRVQRIGHVRVHAGESIGIRACAHASGNRFVISKRPASARISATDGEIVHGPGTGGRNAIRYGLGKRAQQNINDPL